MSKGRRVARRTRRLRPAILLWSSCAIAALVLALGASGTLSSWTHAIITNSNNSTATAKAVILQETDGTSTCNSSDGAQTTINSYTCTTINKYGGTATPLTPGATVTKDVTFKNIGTANGTSFQLAPASCGQTPSAGTGTPAAANVCTNGDLTIAVSCSPGATYTSGTAWTDLAYAAAAPPTATKTHAATGTELNPGQSWTCEFSIALKSTAAITDQGITVSQALTWTLNG